MSSKISALTQNTTPLGSDHKTLVTTGLANNRRFMGDDNLLPNGFMVNGAISVTVASSNITVALKTKSGGNPSATDPVSVWINGSFRRCVAALSVTKNAGTNWFNSGAAEFAALEQDYFVYLIWNTTPATDIMDIGFARIPYGAVYSDFSTTSTNEKYLAFGNASTPTSTDECVNIGRFAATLSAAASYNWSVPTFTNSNLKQTPTYETRTLAYVPTWASTGTAVSLGNGTLTGEYQIDRRNVKLFGATLIAGSTTTFGTTQYSFVLPFTPLTVSTFRHTFTGYVYDNSATTMYIANGNNVADGTSKIASMQTHGNAAVVSSTVPFTFAQSDQISMKGEYPIA